jgi:hypothetical protein
MRTLRGSASYPRIRQTGAHNVDATGRLSADTGHSIRRAVRYWLTLRGHVRPGILTLKGLLSYTGCVWAALTPCHGAEFRPRKARARIRQDQADIAWLHLAGFDSPEIDGKQARAGHNGFLFGSCSGFDSRAQNMMELLKSAPALIPLMKTPEGLHKHAAQALVAHAIDGAEFARACPWSIRSDSSQ